MEPGIIHISDWYHTFCKLAGVSPTDERAREAKLPTIDSQNVWAVVAEVRGGTRG